MKIPISDLYSPQAAQKKQEVNDLGFPVEMSPEKNKFFVHIPSENFDEQEIDKEKIKRMGTFSTMESSSQMTKLKTSGNFSLSTSQNTYIHDGDKVKFGSEMSPMFMTKSGSIKVRDKVPVNTNKNSKTVVRFNDAVEKAKVYNDQMIKQYKFEKENAEEEADFAELCEILQSNIRV
jgi:hypothetical protein